MLKTYSPFQLKRMSALRQKAKLYYKQGFSLREVGKLVGKSHQWVSVAIKDGNWKKPKVAVDRQLPTPKKPSIEA